jgi:hypothetical protein
MGMSVLFTPKSISRRSNEMNSTKKSSQGTNRKYAAIAGVLFIMGTVPITIGTVLCLPIWNAPDNLNKIAANENLINLNIILQLIMAISCAGISVALYPILKNLSAGLAIGAVVFRLIENMLQILKAVSMVTMLSLSQEFIKAGSPTTSYFQSASEIITTASDWMVGAALICFSIGASMYYIAFYQHRLVPRWLSGWGIVSLVLAAFFSLLVMTKIIPSFGTIQIAANLSIFVQEMVFAVWLIAKGINPAAIASLPAKTATLELLGAA